MGERFKIVVVTPFHNRPDISAIFWENMNDLGLDVVAIVSDEPNKVLANKHAFKVLEYDNNPLGKKWQLGVDYLKEIDFDWLLIVGSDDLVSQHLINKYKDIAQRKGTKYIGLIDAVAMDNTSKKFRIFNGYTNHRKGESIGAGRLVHKDLLEMIDYDVFPNQHKYMDRHLTSKLLAKGIKNTLIRTGLKPYRVGIKDKTALSKGMPNSPFKYDVDLKGWYSDKVINLLLNR